MNTVWNDREPIYRQIRAQVVDAILDGALGEGDRLSSVRQTAAEFQVNSITVAKAYQELTDEQLVDKRRGIGLFVRPGARARLLESERHRFLSEEWPRLSASLKRLGFDKVTLCNSSKIFP